MSPTRRLLTAGLAALALASASPVLAVSPSPSPSPGSTPKPPAVHVVRSWNAAFTAVKGLSGTVRVDEFSNGTGRIILRLRGLQPTSRWWLWVNGGNLKRIVAADRFAYRTGTVPAHVTARTFYLRMTSHQMRAFLTDLTKDGGDVLRFKDANRTIEALIG